MDRQLMRGAFDAAIEACNPEEAVAMAMADPAIASVVDGADRVVVVAIGKAAAAMARGVARVVPGVSGIAVSDHAEDCPIELIIGDHPVPGDASLAGGERVLRTVREAGQGDAVLFLISGGGSALVESLVPGVSLEDLAATTRVLIEGGVPIEEINEVRASLSMVKAGRLAAAAGSRSIASFVLSDVVGEGPEVVASGPSIPSVLGTRASAIIERPGVSEHLPDPVLDAVVALRDPVAPIAQPIVEVGSTVRSAAAARAWLESKGLEVTVLTTELVGPTERAVDQLLSALASHSVVVAAGETVVEVSGEGLGGRNQHAALLTSLAIEGTSVVFAALGTDGRDGPTDAAGGIVDGGSAERMRAAGVDPEAALGDCDSYRALTASDDLVISGPTGTNVADLWIVGTSKG